MKQYPPNRGQGKHEKMIYLEETDERLFQIKTPVKAHYVPLVKTHCVPFEQCK